MYLISAYFDDEINRILNRHIKAIAEDSGNMFMVDNNVPPHLTLLSIEAPSAEVLMPGFYELAGHLKAGEIIIPSIGQLFPYVIFASPVLNEYLLKLQEELIDKYSGIDKVILSKYYNKNSWMPHITLGKTLDYNQMQSAFTYLQKHFSPIKGHIVRIGLARTNPHEDIATIELSLQ